MESPPPFVLLCVDEQAKKLLFCHGHESLESAKDAFQELAPLALQVADGKPLMCIGRHDATRSGELNLSFACPCDAQMYGQYARTHKNHCQREKRQLQSLVRSVLRDHRED